MKSQPEQQADDILRDFANKEHKSMRQLGIIDERRQRTINGREKTFADFFARRKRHEDA
jgi:hypothetical protein